MFLLFFQGEQQQRECALTNLCGERARKATLPVWAIMLELNADAVRGVDYFVSPDRLREGARETNPRGKQQQNLQ